MVDTLTVYNRGWIVDCQGVSCLAAQRPRQRPRFDLSVSTSDTSTVYALGTAERAFHVLYWLFNGLPIQDKEEVIPDARGEGPDVYAL